MTVILSRVLFFTIRLALVAFPAAVAAQDLGGTPNVPNFWDHKATNDRPDSFPDKIQFLATDGFPPFVFRDAQGRLTGFNVDLSRAICIELGSSCSLRIKEFDALVPALEEGEGDAIISGLAPNADLSEKLHFSPDYLKLPARFVVSTGAAFTFSEDDLAGKTISVEAGSRHEAFALKFFPEAFLQSFQTASEARAALRRREVDAHFGDGLALSFWLNSDGAEECCLFAGGPWLEPGYFDTGLSIALRKEDVDRAEAMEYALRSLSQKGTFKELYLRYFPISFY